MIGHTISYHWLGFIERVQSPCEVVDYREYAKSHHLGTQKYAGRDILQHEGL